MNVHEQNVIMSTWSSQNKQLLLWKIMKSKQAVSCKKKKVVPRVYWSNTASFEKLSVQHARRAFNKSHFLWRNTDFSNVLIISCVTELNVLASLISNSHNNNFWKPIRLIKGVNVPAETMLNVWQKVSLFLSSTEQLPWWLRPAPCIMELMFS